MFTDCATGTVIATFAAAVFAPEMYLKSLRNAEFAAEGEYPKLCV